MSDRDTAPDLLDKAYVRAEALLDDHEARATRRARVLDAVADEPTILPAGPSVHARPPIVRYGGWLAAASVMGLSVLVATRLYQPAPRQEPAATPLIAPPFTTSADAMARAPAADAPSPTPRPLLQARRSAAPNAMTVPAPATIISPPAEPPSPPPLLIKPVEAPRPAPPPSSPALAMAPSEEPHAGAPPAPNRLGLIAGATRDVQVEAVRRGATITTAPSAQTAGLRAAAAAGRTADVKTLLAQGVAVDAPDTDGETALMKSIEADHPAIATLLRQHGASLDARNRAGERARDMALAKGDLELNEALGLDP